MIKGSRVLLLFIVFALLLGGCKERTTPTQTAKKEAAEILECVKSDDHNGIKNLLMPSMRDLPDIDAQIVSFLDFIDGEIISCSDPKGGADSYTMEHGKKTFEKLTGDILNIKTDTGKTYRISHYSVRINAEKPEDLGVFYIAVFDVDGYDPASGYPDSAKASIGSLQ